MHDGFLDSYKEIQDKLVATIFDQLDKYPQYKVAVTGHSLGGATALLCALDLYQRNKNFTQENLFLYTQGQWLEYFVSLTQDNLTFANYSLTYPGQPRVGNPAFAKYVANADFTYKRTIHERDRKSNFQLLKLSCIICKLRHIYHTHKSFHTFLPPVLDISMPVRSSGLLMTIRWLFVSQLLQQAERKVT